MRCIYRDIEFGLMFSKEMQFYRVNRGVQALLDIIKASSDAPEMRHIGRVIHYLSTFCNQPDFGILLQLVVYCSIRPIMDDKDGSQDINQNRAWQENALTLFAKIIEAFKSALFVNKLQDGERVCIVWRDPADGYASLLHKLCGSLEMHVLVKFMDQMYRSLDHDSELLFDLLTKKNGEGESPQLLRKADLVSFEKVTLFLNLAVEEGCNAKSLLLYWFGLPPVTSDDTPKLRDEERSAYRYPVSDQAFLLRSFAWSDRTAQVFLDYIFDWAVNHDELPLLKELLSCTISTLLAGETCGRKIYQFFQIIDDECLIHSNVIDDRFAFFRDILSLYAGSPIKQIMSNFDQFNNLERFNKFAQKVFTGHETEEYLKYLNLFAMKRESWLLKKIRPGSLASSEEYDTIVRYFKL